MIYYDRPYLTLTWLADENVGWGQWKGEVDGESLREGLNVALQLVAEKGVQKWLVDSSDIGSINPQDVKWINETWTPQAVDAGLRWMAMVMAKRVVMQVMMKSYVARINDREISHAYFSDVDEALEWLAAQ